MDSSRKRKAEDVDNDIVPPRPPPPPAVAPPRPPLPPRPSTTTQPAGPSPTSAKRSSDETVAEKPSLKSDNGVRGTDSSNTSVTAPVTNVGFSLGNSSGSAAPSSASAGVSRPTVTMSRISTIKPKTKPKVTAASIFGDDDDDDDEEEMPAAARMRMRNCGKFTPTSSGPNTFNKTAKGFVDPRGKVWDKLDEEPQK
eukprot:m.1606269 g.1606269  ORF g.1606269 m.1606269 type:complete len:197 (-) comp25360_c0_seq2:5658-6248(-)